MWKLVEDNDREIEENTNEDGDPLPFPSIDQLGNAAEWGHANPSILQAAARITHVEPTAPENDEGDFDPEQALLEVQKADPFEPRLKPITKDSPVYGRVPAWILKTMGDTTFYKDQ